MAFAAEARLRSQVSPCEILDGQSGTLPGLSPIISVLVSQYQSKNAPYSSSSTCQSYQMTNGTKPGNRPQIQCPFKKKTALDRKIFSHWILKGRVMNQAVNRWLNCWRHTFNTLLINVRFVVHKVAMGLDYQLVFCFSAVSTIPPTP